MGDNTKFRDYRGTQGQIDDADGTTERRRGLTRGRVGVSRPKSPRPGVRDPGKPRKGSEGEPEYGAPIDRTPAQEGESDKRKRARPDPLKKK